jgi:sterol desaturase/sphingolipid hydroxylase (fatty acid hydroxylase superfamily)
VTESDFQLVRAAGFLAAAGLATALQRLAPHAPVRASRRVNVSLWALNLVVLGALCGACACTVARWAAAGGIGLLNLLDVPLGLGIALTVVGLDLVSYLWHRSNHRFALLWRFHRVHHSDLDLTASTGVRFHPGELVLSLPVRLAALVLLGAPVAGVVVFELAFAIANLIEHANVRVPATLEQRLVRLVVTPALHRRHHSVERAELDSNFGTIFTLWDRLLGTYGEAASAAQVETGLVGLRDALSLARALVLPFGPAVRGE